MVVLVITIHGVVEQSFKSNSSFGYNLIVGSRGGSLQLTANTVYYLSRPVENIPYEYYLAFEDAGVRSEQLQHSYAAKAATSQDVSQALNGAMMSMADFGVGTSSIGNALISDAESRALYYQMELDQDGLLSLYTQTAVPICMGDSLGEFRVAATIPEFFTDLVLDVDTEEKFETSEGRFFKTRSAENGFFEAVLGHTVAKRLKLKVGDIINPIHGMPDDPNAHTHEQGFRIVGILARTGTPHDRAAFVNMEGFYLMEDHANIAEPETELPRNDDWKYNEDGEIDEFLGGTSRSWEDGLTTVAYSATQMQVSDELWARRIEAYSDPLPIEEREVTAVLVRTSKGDGDDFGIGAMGMESSIGEGRLTKTLPWSDFRDSEQQTSAQAVNPISEIFNLFETLVNPVRTVLLALTVMIVVVSAISILVGIYSSMAQRKRDIAIMRALGAGRDTVMSVMFFETIILTMAGAFVGVFCAHLIMEIARTEIETRTGVSVGFFSIAPPLMNVANTSGMGRNVLEFLLSGEVVIVAAMFVLSILVGVYPAWTAYRTDVSRSLTE